MRVHIRGMRFGVNEQMILSRLLSLGLPRPERVVLVRTGQRLSQGAVYCSAFLWYNREQDCGLVVEQLRDTIFCSDWPVVALLAEDRRQPEVPIDGAAPKSRAKARARLSGPYGQRIHMRQPPPEYSPLGGAATASGYTAASASEPSAQSSQAREMSTEELNAALRAQLSQHGYTMFSP
jgi:hypothetical protein